MQLKLIICHPLLCSVTSVQTDGDGGGGGGGERGGLGPLSSMIIKSPAQCTMHAALVWTCPPCPSIALLPASTPKPSPQSGGPAHHARSSVLVAPSCASRRAEGEPGAAWAATCTPGLGCCGIHTKMSKRHALVGGCWRRLSTFFSRAAFAVTATIDAQSTAARSASTPSYSRKRAKAMTGSSRYPNAGAQSVQLKGGAGWLDSSAPCSMARPLR